MLTSHVAGWLPDQEATRPIREIAVYKAHALFSTSIPKDNPIRLTPELTGSLPILQARALGHHPANGLPTYSTCRTSPEVSSFIYNSPKCHLAPPTRCSRSSTYGRWPRVTGWLSLLSHNDDDIGPRTDHCSARSPTAPVPGAAPTNLRSHRSRIRTDPLDASHPSALSNVARCAHIGFGSPLEAMLRN